MRQFEEEWSKWGGCKYSVYVNSGASANLITIAVLKELVGNGEILVPPLTWVSDIAAVLHSGYQPVFVDINTGTLALDTDQVLANISQSTNAVFLTHVQGFNGLTQRLLDCLEELKKLDDNSVDLLCTDPPYGYGFMGKHWDTFKEKDSTKSQQVGWMSPGMKKDTYGMKEFFDPIWKECLRVLKPGGFAFIMSAPRADVQGEMIKRLEKAGFRVDFLSLIHI